MGPMISLAFNQCSGGVLVSANVVMVVAILIQPVLLAETCRGSTTATEDIVPPIRRSTPVSGRMEPVWSDSYEEALYLHVAAWKSCSTSNISLIPA